MASTYTTNLGIEKIGAGEQAGAWGTTTNNNFDLIDRAINGVGAITLSGTAHNLTTSDGTLSEGGNKVLVLGGTPSGTNTITITPNDQDKMYFVHNNSGQTATFRQGDGTGGTVSIPNGSKGLIFADGAGTSAKVTDLLDGFSSGGTKVASTGAELNILDGDTSATATTIVDADRIVLNDGGTMVQAAVTDVSTYVNQNLVEVKSLATISGTLNVIAGGATSVYQQIVVSSGTQTVNVQTDNLVAGQYVIIDKKTSANKITINWNAGDGSTALSGSNVSTGISLGDSVDFALGLFNGTSFSFTETVKF
tara:strand:- start:3899 stop:4822 length:924 start_codon:yes stop_codon:yes gene_type:complete